MFFLHHRNRWWKFYHADLPPAPVEDMAWKRGVRNKYYLRKRSHLNLYMPSIYRRLTDKAHRGLAATVTSEKNPTAVENFTIFLKLPLYYQGHNYST